MMDIHSLTDVDSLCAAMTQGFRAQFVFFWRHRPVPDGAIDKTCLSQWWPSPFQVEGNDYATAEHFMMAEKARLFDDQETRSKIFAAEGPAKVQKLGRQVRGFKDHVWFEKRFSIVVRGNVAKFAQSEPLKQYLLSTEGRVLVEASPKDRIWGIGLAESDSRSKWPRKWLGLNLLGFALMQARDQILAGES